MEIKFELTVIIIGHNEYMTLEKNLQNLITYTENSKLTIQVVYIDSQSSDGSVELACKYVDKIDNLSVFRLEGQLNAAIARNAGIRYAQGDYILFLDGDVVFDCEFIQHALNLFRQSPKIGAVAGKLLDIYDPEKPEIVVERGRHGKGKCRCLGGNFICLRTTVQKVGFFDERLVINEDIDYSLRIHNLNLDLIKLEYIFGLHFTEPYNEIKRLWNDLARFNYVYPGILLRKYLFRRGIINVIYAQAPVYLRFITLIAMLFVFVNPLFISLPLAIFIYVVVRVKKHLHETLFSRVLSFLKGLQVAVGLFIVKQKPQYQAIKIIG